MASDSVVGLCDCVASCLTNVFSKGALPRNWSKSSLRILALWLNFVFLMVTWTTDWIFLSCCDQLRVSNNSTSQVEDDPKNGSDLISSVVNHSNEDLRGKFENELYVKDILSIAYLTFLVVSTVLLPFHAVTHLFAYWRSTWRQTLVLALECLTFLVEFTAPPILVAILFFSAKICAQEANGNKPFGSCHWRIFAFSIAHILALVWHCWKMASLGLCCCCCSGFCAVLWPCYKNLKVQRNRPRGDAIDQDNHSTLAGTVLNCMPPESDRGSWLNGTMWFILTSWTCPFLIAAFMACASLIVVMVMGQNVLYYGGCSV